MTAKITMTATIAYPWRRSPIMRPKTRGRLNGMASSKNTSIQLVQAVGFSNGCELLAL